MYGYIYRTTNLINGKIYIGQHKATEFDPEYKGSGTSLWNAIRYYGWSKFSVELISECVSEDDMNEQEIKYISEYNSTDKSVGYNITPGGNSRSMIGVHNPMYGKHHTEQSKRLISKNKSNPSEETRQKMSKAAKNRGMSKAIEASVRLRTGKPLSESTRKKLSIANTGKIRSEETRKKISLAHTGKTFHLSVEARQKISESNRRRKYSQATKDKIARSKSKYIYTYNNQDYYGWNSIVEFLRQNKYPSFSQTSLNKIVYGGVVKGYEDLTGKITVRSVGDLDEN